ncbi:MAG: CPBP family intramembrane glutamic endopeptidase, partial [Persicimonas sp.]
MRKSAELRAKDAPKISDTGRSVHRALRALLVCTGLLIPSFAITGILPEEGFFSIFREPTGKLGVIAVLLALLAMDRQKTVRSLQLRRPHRGALGIAALCGLLNIPMATALSALFIIPLAMLGADLDTEPSFYLAMQDPLGIPLGIGLVIIGVIAEELFFRGYLLSRFKPLGKRWAIALSAVLFASFHINFLMFPFGILLGIYTAILVVHSRSIWPAILAHGVGNTMGILMHTQPDFQQILSEKIATIGPHTPW